MFQARGDKVLSGEEFSDFSFGNIKYITYKILSEIFSHSQEENYYNSLIAVFYYVDIS